MRKLLYLPEFLLFQRYSLDDDRLSGFYHLLQFFLCPRGNTSSMIHNGDPGTYLLHFLHIMRSIYNGGTLPVQFADPFKDLVSALGIYGYSRLIQKDQSGSVGNPAGNVQSS